LKISVIIPVKNRASLLPHTLENILGQTLPAHEIIVVDDSSTDTIWQVKQQYNDKVIFADKEGKGPGAARNTGLRIATGDAIQFFDSDDLMTANKLEVQNRLLVQHHADFVYGPYVRATEQNNTWKQVDAIIQYRPLPARRLPDLVLEGWCTLTQTVLFDASFIREIGYWREDLMPHEDWEYWFRISKLAKTYVHENETCVLYRQHHQQITDQAVSDKNRSLDGLKARSIIAAELTNHFSVYSKWIFSGAFVQAIQTYYKKFGELPPVHAPAGKLAGLYYRVWQKLGRMQTGTAWRKMLGVNTSSAQFEQYLSKLL